MNHPESGLPTIHDFAATLTEGQTLAAWHVVPKADVLAKWPYADVASIYAVVKTEEADFGVVVYGYYNGRLPGVLNGWHANVSARWLVAFLLDCDRQDQFRKDRDTLALRVLGVDPFTCSPETLGAMARAIPELPECVTPPDEWAKIVNRRFKGIEE